MEQVLIQLVIPLIGAFIIGLIVGYMFFKTGRSQRASANTSDVESLRQELLNKSNEADGFKARAAEFRALLSKRDAMVAERDNYLAELEGRLRATEAEVVSLRMSGTPAGRGGAGRRSFVEDDYDLDDDSPFVEEVPTGQIEVIDLRPGIEDYAADDIVDDIEVPVLARTGGDRYADAELLDGPVSLDGGHSGVAHEVVGRSTSDLADDGTAGILDSVSRHAAPPMPRRSTAPTLGPPRTAAAPAAALDESDPADITQERSVRRAPRGPVHSPVSPAVDTPDLSVDVADETQQISAVRSQRASALASPSSSLDSAASDAGTVPTAPLGFVSTPAVARQAPSAPTAPVKPAPAKGAPAKTVVHDDAAQVAARRGAAAERSRPAAPSAKSRPAAPARPPAPAPTATRPAKAAGPVGRTQKPATESPAAPPAKAPAARSTGNQSMPAAAVAPAKSAPAKSPAVKSAPAKAAPKATAANAPAGRTSKPQAETNTEAPKRTTRRSASASTLFDADTPSTKASASTKPAPSRAAAPAAKAPAGKPAATKSAAAKPAPAAAAATKAPTATAKSTAKAAAKPSAPRSAAHKASAARRAAPTPPVSDDLLEIVGVGPKLAKLLNEQGITSFKQLALLTSREEAALDDLLGAFKGRIEREGWVRQARELHQTKYGEKLSASRR